MEWQKTRDRNEALDCRVYARAAASACGIERFGERHWRAMEEQIGAAVKRRQERREFSDDDEGQAPVVAAARPAPARRVIRSRFLSR
jgi:phage terminase large subunit GpA-like protein